MFSVVLCIFHLLKYPSVFYYFLLFYFILFYVLIVFAGSLSSCSACRVLASLVVAVTVGCRRAADVLFLEADTF